MVMLYQYVLNLERLRSIAFDVRAREFLIPGVQALDQARGERVPGSACTLLGEARLYRSLSVHGVECPERRRNHQVRDAESSTVLVTVIRGSAMLMDLASSPFSTTSLAV